MVDMAISPWACHLLCPGFEESAPSGQINFSSPSGARPAWASLGHPGPAPDSAITPLSNIAAHEQTKMLNFVERKRSNENQEPRPWTTGNKTSDRATLIELNFKWGGEMLTYSPFICFMSSISILWAYWKELNRISVHAIKMLCKIWEIMLCYVY